MSREEFDGWRLEMPDSGAVEPIRLRCGDTGRGEHRVVGFVYAAGDGLPFGGYNVHNALGRMMKEVIGAGEHAHLLQPGERSRAELLEAAQAEARVALESALVAVQGRRP